MAGLTLTGLTLAAGAAQAHLGHVVSRAERYLKVDIEPEGARVVVSLSLGPSETLRIMRDADADQDGAVGSDEVDTYMAAWAEGLREEMPISVDGERVAASWGEPYFDPIGAVRASVGAVELVARVPLEPGDHTLVLRDRMRVETFDRTDVAFHSEQGGNLMACGLSETPVGCDERFAYDADNVPGAIAATVHVDGLSLGERLGLLGGFGLALVVALVSWWRVMRRRRAPAT